MKQLEVQIMGQSYLLGCPDGGDARLLDAVERVDTAMCKIREVGKVRARDRIAVLAALNLAFDLMDHRNNHATDQAPSNQQPLTETSAAIKSLIARLDEALGNDDRLI
jgi:cell division protein ZapA